MESLNFKLQILQDKLLKTDESIKIMILGLGSVGHYLLDYLISSANPRLEIIVVGRAYDKLISDVNILKTAATIRHQLRSKIHIEGDCDFEKIDDLIYVFSKWKPDFIVNTSRVYAGLKYGSISWSNLRAYGVWTPLSVKYAYNIMVAYKETNSTAITINTSYSDAVIPWIKATGIPTFDFGSGNLNHLIPRIKFYIAEKFDIDSLDKIDVTLAASHFHDVVISKEGHAEGIDIPIIIKYNNKALEFDKEELWRSCSIEMPTNQKRNMMNASSNFEIIQAILNAILTPRIEKIHSPGVMGLIGGYPIIINGKNKVSAYIDDSAFSLNEMKEANRKSIYLDGIESVSEEGLVYTEELLAKIKNKFNIKLPKKVNLDNIESVRNQLINDIIIPSISK